MIIFWLEKSQKPTFSLFYNIRFFANFDKYNLKINISILALVLSKLIVVFGKINFFLRKLLFRIFCKST